MTDKRTGVLGRTAIGARIDAVRYDSDSGYIVLTLNSGSELWVKASYEEGYHLIVERTATDSRNSLIL